MAFLRVRPLVCASVGFSSCLSVCSCSLHVILCVFLFLPVCTGPNLMEFVHKSGSLSSNAPSPKVRQHVSIFENILLQCSYGRYRNSHGLVNKMAGTVLVLLYDKCIQCLCQLQECLQQIKKLNGKRGYLLGSSLGDGQPSHAIASPLTDTEVSRAWRR